MRRRPAFLLLLVAALTMGLSLAACGGDGESSEEKAAEEARSEAFAPTCEMTAMTGDTGLPADFPVPSEVTWVKSEKAGPSTIVEGWAEDDMDDLYDEWHTASSSRAATRSRSTRRKSTTRRSRSRAAARAAR
jgi:hypothetical protein